MTRELTLICVRILNAKVSLRWLTFIETENFSISFIFSYLNDVRVYPPLRANPDRESEPVLVNLKEKRCTL